MITIINSILQMGTQRAWIPGTKSVHLCPRIVHKHSIAHYQNKHKSVAVNPLICKRGYEHPQ